MFLNKLLAILLAPLMRTMESMHWMMPRASLWGNKILVYTNSRNYTIYDFEQMFKDLGLKNSYGMYKGTLKIDPDLPPPNVDTYCYYGTGIPTVKAMKYDGDFSGAPPTGQPKIIHGDGDGTVNIESARMCLKWVSKQAEHTYEHKAFAQVTHHGIILKKLVLFDIAKIVDLEAAADKASQWDRIEL